MDKIEEKKEEIKGDEKTTQDELVVEFQQAIFSKSPYAWSESIQKNICEELGLLFMRLASRRVPLELVTYQIQSSSIPFIVMAFLASQHTTGLPDRFALEIMFRSEGIEKADLIPLSINKR